MPGETTLLLASFLAFSEHRLHLGWIIVVATCAAAIGDNLGYAIGKFGGRPLLDHYQNLFRIRPATLKYGEAIFQGYGPATIFFARFVAGLRVIAGPLAGVLHMPWRLFVIFNFLGAAVWVSAIATAGYLFGGHWHALARGMERFNLVVLIVALIALLFLWWRYRRRRSREDH